MNDLKIFSGRANPPLAKRICSYLSLPMGAPVDVAERERFARVADGLRSVPRHVKQTRRQRRERQQIETVVLEDRGELARVAGADELKIAAGDLEARHVARAAHAENLLLERAERTAAVLL